MTINNQYTTMMTDIEKTDKMFGVVFSDGKGQFCEIGTAVENIKQEFYRGKVLQLHFWAPFFLGRFYLLS